MADKFAEKKLGAEGYVYNSYGNEKYLKYAVTSVQTLRRYDASRPAAIFCTEEHRKILDQPHLKSVFQHIFILPEQNRSITGFKHNICDFMPYERNIYLDGDIVVCRDPDRLWQTFSSYPFTATGNHSADNFFGGPKGVGIIKDMLLGRRNRTLKRFGLTYLPRIQSGVMYAADYNTAKAVSDKAKEMLYRKAETHFRSRTEEAGRSEESCEWSLAMAMADLELQIHPWFNSYESVQLDFIDDFTVYDSEFKSVSCLYYKKKFVYNFRGFPVRWLQKLLIQMFTILPGSGDYHYVTPYFLHFGWYHQKKPFFQLADQIWNDLHQNGGPVASES
ncbi:hypothetical protein DYD21_11025 [Rhodohalobacter sp. SW132]|uniref:hypothetical protein n=1 Tax=Rhodohalobacter sp. SW132 TaxID=2293433 RepID=UPI000E239412|nr:hypothetical protein [Rhodohalobacter sp. SW132]REL33306.1 hypothetical protein DYD21_11025 [Rhodohalobacter sp. SW132]